MKSTIQKVNLAEKFAAFNDYWNPRIAGSLNGQQVKLVKFQGEFIWHSHENEDELFLVIRGSFNMELENESIRLMPGEFVIIPKGIKHRPVAESEVEVLLFEPGTTVNTGEEQHDLTRKHLDQI